MLLSTSHKHRIGQEVLRIALLRRIESLYTGDMAYLAEMPGNSSILAEKVNETAVRDAFIAADHLATVPDDLDASNYDISCNATTRGSFCVNVTMHENSTYAVLCEHVDLNNVTTTFMLELHKGGMDGNDEGSARVAAILNVSGNGTVTYANGIEICLTAIEICSEICRTALEICLFSHCFKQRDSHVCRW